jgi:hypothetical protein
LPNGAGCGAKRRSSGTVATKKQTGLGRRALGIVNRGEHGRGDQRQCGEQCGYESSGNPFDGRRFDCFAFGPAAGFVKDEREHGGERRQ